MNPKTHEEKLELIEKHIKSYPDFPKKGVLFRDIFSVLQEPTIFSYLKDVMIDEIKTIGNVDCIVGLDARGFLFGPIIALELQKPFVPVRKKGKLPGEVKSLCYNLEYGHAEVEIQVGVIKKDQRVLIVDDLLATGGSLSAAASLVKQLEGKVVGCLVVMELQGLNGRSNIPDVDIHSLIKF